MREVSFVKNFKFNFNGSIAKRALVIGDADNDQRNELVCANLQGVLSVFKDRQVDAYATVSNLGMVTACTVGDVINLGQNFVAALNMDGWLFILELSSNLPSKYHSDQTEPATTASIFDNSCIEDKSCGKVQNGNLALDQPKQLKLIYQQRMPANCREMLSADLDGDGQNELIIGLTDRVLRTYRWIKISPTKGKFVGLCKWEFADQIGSVSLNASRYTNCRDIVVAQPGGTYAKLECIDKKQPIDAAGCLIQNNDQRKSTSSSPSSGSNVKTEYINKLTPDYHQLVLTQMRNHHISTEVLGGIRNGKNSDTYSLIVIATLDGTLMLVDEDEILWSLQVDHQLFALAKLETKFRPNFSRLPQSESTCTIVSSTDKLSPKRPNHHLSDRSVSSQNVSNDKYVSQYFAACAWNGKTYIIDEERNYLRFKFDEAVSAFTAGNYHFDDKHYTSLVYATFNNKIVLYYDVVSDSIRPTYLLEEVMTNPENSDILELLETLEEKLEPTTPTSPSDQNHIPNPLLNKDQRLVRLRNLLQDVLQTVCDDELNSDF